MPEPVIEILDPLPPRTPPSKWRKYGPLLFWGTMVALPAMNMTSAIFNYKTLKLEVELEKLRNAAEDIPH